MLLQPLADREFQGKVLQLKPFQQKGWVMSQLFGFQKWHDSIVHAIAIAGNIWYACLQLLGTWSIDLKTHPPSTCVQAAGHEVNHA